MVSPLPAKETIPGGMLATLAVVVCAVCSWPDRSMQSPNSSQPRRSSAPSVTDGQRLRRFKLNPAQDYQPSLVQAVSLSTMSRHNCLGCLVTSHLRREWDSNPRAFWAKAFQVGSIVPVTHQPSPISLMTCTYIPDSHRPSRRLIGSCSPFCSPNVSPSHGEFPRRRAPVVRVRSLGDRPGGRGDGEGRIPLSELRHQLGRPCCKYGQGRCPDRISTV